MQIANTHIYTDIYLLLFSIFDRAINRGQRFVAAAEDNNMGVNISSHSSIIRREIRSKYKQALVAQSKVFHSLAVITLSLIVTIPIETVVISP